MEGRRVMRLGIIALLAALGILVEPTSCRGENKEYLSAFETVWNKVHVAYYDSTFGGLNWKDIHDRYQPQIAAAETDQAFYRLINNMLWELKVSHANVVPPGSFALYEPLVFAEGSSGINVRLLDGAVVITSVTSGSSAQQAGLSPGCIIQAIDGSSVEEIAREAESRMAPPYNDRGRIAKVTKAMLGRLFGPPGTEVSIAYSERDGEKREKKIVRTKRYGVAAGPRGSFFLAIDFEAKRLENGIGYIRLNVLLPPLAPKISNAIKSMGDVSGIILDLRGNSGGEIEGMPDLFLAERTRLYLSRARSKETDVFADPAQDAFQGPLAVLIDKLSGSASELFAACLQSIGRAVIVGERSPGSVMEMDQMILPSGAIFMYPVAQLATPNGTVLEGYGVVPDIEVELDREMLLNGVDAQLDSAVRYLEKGVQK